MFCKILVWLRAKKTGASRSGRAHARCSGLGKAAEGQNMEWLHEEHLWWTLMIWVPSVPRRISVCSTRSQCLKVLSPTYSSLKPWSKESQCQAQKSSRFLKHGVAFSLFAQTFGLLSIIQIIQQNRMWRMFELQTRPASSTTWKSWDLGTYSRCGGAYVYSIYVNTIHQYIAVCWYMWCCVCEV